MTRHPVAVLVLVVLLLLCYLVTAISSIFPTLGSGLANAVSGTSYASEDADLLGSDEDYTALERELANTIASIESDHPSYDEYRYSVDEIGHNPMSWPPICLPDTMSTPGNRYRAICGSFLKPSMN